MKYTVVIAPAATRELKRIPGDALRRIKEAIDTLAANPRPRGCSKLRGATDLFRVRVGDYRIIYQVQDRELLVLVLRIGHRRDVYDRLQ